MRRHRPVFSDYDREVQYREETGQREWENEGLG